MSEDGKEILEAAGAEPTLDEYLRRDPATLTPKDLAQIVVLERKRRAMFIEASAKRKADKVEKTEEDSDGEV
jgi:hypothetical protein